MIPIIDSTLSKRQNIHKELKAYKCLIDLFFFLLPEWTNTLP